MTKKDKECKFISFEDWLTDLAESGIISEDRAKDIVEGLSTKELFYRDIYHKVSNIDEQMCSLIKQKESLIKRKENLEKSITDMLKSR